MRLTIALLGLLLAGPGQTEIELIADQSSLSFVSIKNVDIAEAHRFGRLSGALKDDGVFEVTIHLDTVDTLIPIRDERIRAELFQTETYPLASASGSVPMAEIDALSAGASMTLDVPFALSLHGTQTQHLAKVRVTRAGSALEVTTVSPVLLQAQAVGLDSGIEALREIAGLESIGKAVPVYFVLRFGTH